LTILFFFLVLNIAITITDMVVDPVDLKVCQPVEEEALLCPKEEFDYGSGASASGGSLYSHPSTSLDSAGGMNSMDSKYGSGMEYTPHTHGTF
jgi:hypothetical protein